MRATMPQPALVRRYHFQHLREILPAVVVGVLATLTTSCDRPPVNRNTAQPLETVQRVDLNRYLGRWYEIARLPNQFEVDCVGVTADYALNADGSIKVVNTCRKTKLDGPVDTAEGRATIADATTKAKLSVTFFWPFAGDYWVIGLAEDYSWALVGEPSGRYLWLLARTPTIDDALREQLTEQLKAKGYNTGALYWTPQPPT
jgi:apolipoprotein D and lipocalin family protein